MSEWDRDIQNKMIPIDTLGLEVLSGQIKVLHLCVKQWQNFKKDYRNESRREQILSLAEECGHGFLNFVSVFFKETTYLSQAI